jgi:hypothetical protein
MKSDKKSKRFSFFQKGGNTMRKKMTLLIMAVVIGMLFTACSESFVEDPNLQTEKEEEQETVPESPENTENIESEAIEYRYTEEGYIVPEQAEEIIKEISDTVLKAIAEKDVKTWAAYVHPEKGVRFTPYTYVEKDKDIIFTKDQIESFFDNEKTYLWGYYDGSGDDILLTPSEYYEKFIYTHDFLNAEKIGYNTVLSFGNAMENQFEVYENPIIVEYYFSGFDTGYDGMDWRSLRLVFQEYRGGWYLTGIINNQWTI